MVVSRSIWRATCILYRRAYYSTLPWNITVKPSSNLHVVKDYINQLMSEFQIIARTIGKLNKNILWHIGVGTWGGGAKPFCKVIHVHILNYFCLPKFYMNLAPPPHFQFDFDATVFLFILYFSVFRYDTILRYTK